MMSRPSGFSDFVGGSFTARDHIVSDSNRVAVPLRIQEFDRVVARPKGHAYMMKEALVISGTGTQTGTRTGKSVIRTWRNES